jgi:hypothetical protein
MALIHSPSVGVVMISPVSHHFEKPRKVGASATHPACRLAKPIRRAELCGPLRRPTSAGSPRCRFVGAARIDKGRSRTALASLTQHFRSKLLRLALLRAV